MSSPLNTMRSSGMYLPDQFTDQQYKVSSTLWNSEAFSMKVQLTCKHCQYISATEFPLSKEDGRWGSPCNTYTRHYDNQCMPLKSRNARPVDFGKHSVRENSFTSSDWKDHKTSKYNKTEELAAQGLHYRGFDDVVSCSDCFSSFSDWQAENIRWLHAQSSDVSCVFTGQRKEESWKSVCQWLCADKFDQCNKYFKTLSSDKKHAELKLLTGWAISLGKNEALQYLLKQADKPVESAKVNDQEVGIIMHAINSGQNECLHTLLDSEKALRNSGTNYQYQDEYGQLWSPLGLAVRLGRLDIMDILISNHYKPTGVGCLVGSTRIPLWKLCMELDNVPALKLLINRGLNVNSAIYTSPDGHRFYPVHCATYQQDTDALELLLSHGADINQKTPSARKPRVDCNDTFDKHKHSAHPITQQTPLHIAATGVKENWCDSTFYERLKRHGANESLKDSTGNTPVFYLGKS
ncbi:ankyrin repeat domain-containing protein [Endozoicomonas atrinae]|uniref:ankyrin repeat domain-containing protein n=1 Tax=Endozoicomonas atrinae TaxID=1333660 RepID=UPI003B0077D6